MNIRVLTFNSDQKESLNQAFAIRQQVYVVEQNIDEFLEYDGYDSESIHLLIFENEIPVATARWRDTLEGVKLERFAVLKPYRGNGYGKLLLRNMLSHIIPTPKLVYIHAQQDAIGFYEKLGFKIIGEMFLEAGIMHYMMIFFRNTVEI